MQPNDINDLAHNSQSWVMNAGAEMPAFAHEKDPPGVGVGGETKPVHEMQVPPLFRGSFWEFFGFLGWVSVRCWAGGCE